MFVALFVANLATGSIELKKNQNPLGLVGLRVRVKANRHSHPHQGLIMLWAHPWMYSLMFVPPPLGIQQLSIHLTVRWNLHLVASNYAWSPSTFPSTHPRSEPPPRTTPVTRAKRLSWDNIYFRPHVFYFIFYQTNFFCANKNSFSSKNHFFAKKWFQGEISLIPPEKIIFISHFPCPKPTPSGVFFIACVTTPSTPLDLCLTFALGLKP